MVNYRRNLVPGGTYFFTVTLRDRSSRLLVEHVDSLRTAFRKVKHKHPFHIDAIVILPEHLHIIWTLPEGDTDYPGRWRAVKSAFTRAVVKSGVAVARNEKGEYALWQRRYWEHTIADEDDFRRHVDYIHFNPIKQAWMDQTSRRLAAFIVSPIREARYIATRLGRLRKRRKIRRVESSPDATQWNPGVPVRAQKEIPVSGGAKNPGFHYIPSGLRWLPISRIHRFTNT